MVCILTSVRRIQIHIDEQLDDAAAREAARRGVSKAALIRDSLARVVDVEADAPGPWTALDGWLDDAPIDDIDDVIYGDAS